jgi:hypothetical protein
MLDTNTMRLSAVFEGSLFSDEADATFTTAP